MWANSAALLAGRTDEIAALAGRHGLKAMLRPGLALYGLAPRFEPGFDEDKEPAGLVAARVRLKPVLSWKSAVVGVRSVEAGAVVGYNGTFVATEPMRLALVAVGYADGLDTAVGESLQPAGARGAGAGCGADQHGPDGAGRYGDCRG
jgi:alanine racemase